MRSAPVSLACHRLPNSSDIVPAKIPNPPERTELTDMCRSQIRAQGLLTEHNLHLRLAHPGRPFRSIYPTLTQIPHTHIHSTGCTTNTSPSTHTATQSSGTNARNLQPTPPCSRMSVTSIRSPCPRRPAYGPYRMRQERIPRWCPTPHACADLPTSPLFTDSHSSCGGGDKQKNETRKGTAGRQLGVTRPPPGLTLFSYRRTSFLRVCCTPGNMNLSTK